MMEIKLLHIVYLALTVNVFLALALAQGGGSTGGGGGYGTVNASGSLPVRLASEFCGIVNDIRDVIGILALAMFLVGAILYAGGNFLPAAGNVKSSTQGWAMGMIIGGVIGIILVLIAPYIISGVISFANGSIPQVSC